MLRKVFAALGVVAVMATTSLAVVSPALAEETPLERLEIVEAQPPVQKLEQPLESPVEIQSETLSTIQPSVSSLQPTEVPVRTIDDIRMLEPSRVTTSDNVASGYPLVVDLERPLTTPRPTDISSINPTTQIKVQPSSQPEPTQVEEMPRKTVERKTAKTITPHFPAQSTPTKFTFSKEQIVPALNVRDLEPSRVTNVSLSDDRSADFLPTPQTTLIPEPSQLLERPKNAPPARPASRHEGSPSVREVTLANRVSNFTRVVPRSEDTPQIKPVTNPIPENNIVPFTRQRVTRVTPVSPVRVQQPISRSASDLGGPVVLNAQSVLPENPAVVERPISTATQNPTQTSAEQPVPSRPTGTLSVGVVVGTETIPTLETAVGLEYRGYETRLRFNRLLRGGTVTVGIDSKLPLSSTTSLTLTADNINVTPELSAKVEAQISEGLTTSVTVRNFTVKPDVELATQFQISEQTRLGVSLTNLAAQPQVTVEAAHKLSNTIEASASVSNLANPSVGLGMAIELSPQLKLEAHANDVFGNTSYETRMTYTFTF